MNGTVDWVILGLTFLVGGLTGAVLYYLLGGGSRDAERLREELKEAKEEAEKYRLQVTEHFEKTSELFEDVTARYRNLYDHLSHGAANFCDDIQHNPRLKFSAAELLPGATEAAAAEAEQAAAPASEPAEADPDAPLEGEKVAEPAEPVEAAEADTPAQAAEDAAPEVQSDAAPVEAEAQQAVADTDEQSEKAAETDAVSAEATAEKKASA